MSKADEYTVWEVSTEVQATPTGPWPYRTVLSQAGVMACRPASPSWAFPATGRDGQPSCPIIPP